MGKAGIGFSKRREEGLGAERGVMPIHQFYWELIARQNWEAIGIDHQL